MATLEVRPRITVGGIGMQTARLPNPCCTVSCAEPLAEDDLPNLPTRREISAT